MFPGFSEQIERKKQIQVCKEWLPERNWLVGNLIDITAWDQEKEYQECLKKLKLQERIDKVKLTRVVRNTVDQKAQKRAVRAAAL